MNKSIPLKGALSILLMFVFSIGSAQDRAPNYNKPNWNKAFFDLQRTYLDSLVQWQESVVLHVANEQVGGDNQLFFKGYLLTGAQQNRHSFSGVLNVELLDGNGAMIKRQFHKVVDGMVEGHMELPINIAPGKYYFKAYTRWMRNYGEDFFALEGILIGSPLGEEKVTGNLSDILITPEGGTILSDHENRLVFKIPLSRATKAGQAGRILDDKGQEVATVNYYSTYIGTAIFKPMSDKYYQLELENGAIYPIPKAEIQGYLLHVNNLDENNAKIQVTASSEVLGTVVTLVGTSGGIRYFENQLEFKDGNIVEVNLSKRDIPYGIFTLKLVDDIGTELARRPIWIDGERLHIDIKPISSDTDESVYKIKVTDKTNSPIKTRLAISANRYEVNSERVMEEYSLDHINLFTYPYDMGGANISMDRKNRFLRDLNILVTDAGFENSSIEGNRLVNNIKFPFQKGLELTGYAYDLDNKLLVNCKIQIMAQTEDGIWLRETETDANGLLRLEEMQINGITELIFRTKGKDTKSRLVKVIPLKEWEQEKNNSFSDITKRQERVQSNENTSLEQVDTKPLAAVDTTGLIKLKEVEVNENRVKDRKYTPSIYGIDVPSNRTKYQDPKRPKSFGQLLSGIPGVAVSEIGLNVFVRILRAKGPTLLVLDGFPLPQGNHGPSLGGPIGTSLHEITNMVYPEDIERIEVLIGADAAIFGTRGSGGAIVFYTRSGIDQEFISRKEGQLVFEGYEPILEFDPYKQGLSKRTKEKAKLLYWNPKLETDVNGEAIIKIPLLPHGSKIKIEASTITPDGKIGSLSTNF